MTRLRKVHPAAELLTVQEARVPTLPERVYTERSFVQRYEQSVQEGPAVRQHLCRILWRGGKGKRYLGFGTAPGVPQAALARAVTILAGQRLPDAKAAAAQYTETVAEAEQIFTEHGGSLGKKFLQYAWEQGLLVDLGRGLLTTELQETVEVDEHLYSRSAIQKVIMQRLKEDVGFLQKTFSSMCTRQTYDELSTGTTVYKNKIGFSAAHAGRATALFNQATYTAEDYQEMLEILQRYPRQVTEIMLTQEGLRTLEQDATIYYFAT